MTTLLSSEPERMDSVIKTILLRYGFSGAVAGFLLWWMTNVLGATVQKTNDLMNEHVRAMDVLVGQVNELRSDQERVEYLLRQICYNTATKQAAPGCNQVARR